MKIDKNERGEPPEIIRSVGFDFHWSEEKVWQLDLPVEDMRVDQLLWHLDFPFWRDESGKQYSVSPKQVLQHPGMYTGQYKRITEANLQYPLDVMWWRDRWVLLDGLHRFTKTILNGAVSVKIRKVPIEAIPEIRV